MTFAEKLKSLRTAAGWTQAELADKSGIPLGSIRDYEQGKRDPALSAAQKLARGLGVSLSAFDVPDEGSPSTSELRRPGRPRKPDAEAEAPAQGKAGGKKGRRKA
jgi:transcriptional regulator with XRE-family HTH domain